MATEPTPPGPGRPRDPRIDEAVLAAVRELLGERGWEGTTIEGVCQRAGVSRPSVRRRYPTKADLILAAVLETAADVPGRFDPGRTPLPDTGSLHGDVRLMLTMAARVVARFDELGLREGLLAALASDEAFARRFWDGFVEPGQRGLVAVLERHRAGGRVRDDVDGYAALSVLAAPVLYGHLFHRPPTEADLDLVATLFVEGIAARPPS